MGEVGAIIEEQDGRKKEATIYTYTLHFVFSCFNNKQNKQ